MLRCPAGCRAFIAVVALSGCAASSIVDTAPASCYRVTLGSWNTELPEQLPAAPPLVQFSDSLGSNVLENGRRVLRSMPPGSVKPYPFQYWVPREQGLLLVVLSNGFTGMTMDLAPQGSNYDGVARGFFDFGTFDVSAPVQLTRAACG
jgi:hypothetical protein